MAHEVSFEVGQTVHGTVIQIYERFGADVDLGQPGTEGFVSRTEMGGWGIPGTPRGDWMEPTSHFVAMGQQYPFRVMDVNTIYNGILGVSLSLHDVEQPEQVSE